MIDSKQEITMAAPLAVRRKAELAKQLAAANATGQLDMNANAVQQAPVVAQVTNHAAPPVNGTEVQAVQIQQAAPAQEIPGAMESGKVPMDDYKTRFENLRTSRNQDKVKVAELEKENARLKAVADQAASAAAAPSPLQLSDEERADMTPEEIKAHERLAGKLEKTLPAPQQQEVAPVLSDQELEVNFFTDVESLVPTWGEINKRADFIQWLQAADGFSGRTRQETLASARANLDANTVVTLFRGFIAEVEQATVQNPVVDNGLGNQAVAATIEPNRGSVAASPLSAESDNVILRNADVQAFYAEKNKVIRRKRMTPELKQQFDAQEAIIRKAHAEGRIR